MSKIIADTIQSRTNAALSIPSNITSTGVLTATTFAGDATGLSGTPNISVGIATANQFSGSLTGVGLTVTGQSTVSNVNVATGIATVAGQTNLANVNVSAASTFGGAVDVNSTSDFGGTLTVSAGDLKVGSAVTIAASGANVTGILTATEVRLKNGTLTERVNIVANKLSAAPNINISNGMVHYFTTAETTTSIPNIYSNTGINTDMSTGDVITVTIITTAAAAGFSTGVEVDGVPISPSWIGGSNPDSGGSAGVDAYSFTIIKTGSAAYKIIGNHSKTS